MQEQKDNPEGQIKRPSIDELVDELTEQVGGSGTFYLYLYVAVGMGLNSVGYFYHTMPFLIQPQVYACEFAPYVIDSDGVCTVANICEKDPRIYSWRVDYSNERSLDNWIQKLDLMCEPAWKGALLGSVSFASMLLTLAVLPSLADKYGRKYIFLCGRVVDCIIFTLLLWTRSWEGMVFLMACFGMTHTTHTNIGRVYLQEFFPKKRQAFAMFLIFGEVCLIGMLVTFYFWKLGRDWFDIVLVGYPTCLLTTVMAFFVPESPRILFVQGRIEEAKRAFDFMARLNRKPCLDWDKVDLSAVKERLRNGTAQVS